jgi:hypothetical protein
MRRAPRVSQVTLGCCPETHLVSCDEHHVFPKQPRKQTPQSLSFRCLLVFSLLKRSHSHPACAACLYLASLFPIYLTPPGEISGLSSQDFAKICYNVVCFGLGEEKRVLEVLGAFGSVWERLGAFGSVWERFQAFSSVFKRFQAFSSVFKRFQAFSSVSRAF